MIDYEVVYSNRKTIGITVERDRKVVVRAPHQANDGAVRSAIQKKQFWIWRKIRDPQKYPNPTTPKEFIAGETFLFLGQQHRVVLTRGKTPTVRLEGDHFEIAREYRSIGGELFRAWYMLQAKAKLPERIAAFAAAMGVSYKRIRICDLRYRWASCTRSGTLTFNWRIIQAPMFVVDYLIVHELAHFLEANHSREFWNIVAVHVPSWERARRWLKQSGSALEW